MSKDFIEISISEFVTVTGGVLAGTLLALFSDKIFLIPGLFILLPGLLEMKGNIYGSLSSRLGSALHLGTVSGRHKRKLIIENLIATIFLTIIVSAILGIIAFFVTYLFFNETEFSIILISILSAIFSGIILLPLTILTPFWLYKKGYDPDNIMGPYITTSGDIFSVLSLLLAVILVT